MAAVSSKHVLQYVSGGDSNNYYKCSSGEESGTVLTLTKDPVAEHYHTSEHINQEINDELQ